MLSLDATRDLFTLFSDGTRLRLLTLLQQEALSVAELVKATALPQPRVSTHLGKLRDAGLVTKGTRGRYRLDSDGFTAEASQIWSVLRESADDPLLDDDARRLVALRQSDGATWADAVAGQMARHYSPGRTWESLARGLTGLLDLGDVLDVASGDGAVAELIACRSRSVTCVDLSERVAEAGRERLSHLDNVRFVQGDMHDLDVPDASFDAAFLLSALPYARDPERVAHEVRRVLRAGGRVAVVTLRQHAHRDVVAPYGHAHLGFEVDGLRALFEDAGFSVLQCVRAGRERRPPHFETLTLYGQTR